MKKNLFSFIGSILGVVSIFLLGAPYLTQEYSSSYSRDAVKTSVQAFIGIFDKNASSSYGGSYLTMGGLLLTVSILCAFAALIVVLTGILKKKNANGTALILSSVNAFTIFYIAKNLSNTIKAYAESSSYKFTVGWGIIIILVLFFAFFVLSLIGFILSNISDKKEEKEKNFDDIYKFKQLLDEGIITKEDFDEKKKQWIL